VKHRFMKYGNLDSQKIDTEAVIKTYWFFAEKFGIMQSLKKHKTIAIPEILEKALVESNFEWEDIQTILTLISYSRLYFLTQLPYGNTISTPVSDIIQTTGLWWEVSDFISSLKQLSKKLCNFSIQLKWASIPILSFKIEKLKDERMIYFTILPLWYQIKQYRRAFYWTHYINAKALEIQTKWKILPFYMKLSSELLSVWRLTDWEISKKKICVLFKDENFTRIKKRIEKIMNITQDFKYSTTGKFVKFQKV
jgi:hypothetical protein